LLEEIVELVHSTKRIIVNENDSLDVSAKGMKNYVTNIDIAVSNYIKEQLSKMYPDYEFMDEEIDSDEHDFKKPTWVLDPIDGTTNLVHGYNQSAVSLALLANGIPILGVVYNPFTEETYTAEINKGAYLNGKHIKVSDVNDIEHSLISIGTYALDRSDKKEEDENIELMNNVFRHCDRIRRLGSSALDLCHVACGRLDAMYERLLAPWDIAAGMIIVREAGGRVTDFDNNLIQPTKRTQIIATNGKVHEKMLDILFPSRQTDRTNKKI